jgi:hypothetical protein
MRPDAATYPPLDIPKPITPGVWIVDSGPLWVLGVPLPVRMTVIRLGTGGLLLHSPTHFTPDLKQELERTGPIEHIVLPNIAHWSFAKDWQRHVPGAHTWSAPGLRDRSQVRRADLRLDHDLGPHPPKNWSDELGQIVITGLGGFTEVAFFHKSSRTLVLTDLVQNLEPEKLPRLMRPVARLLGVTAPAGRAPAYLRAIIKLKGEASRQAAQRLVALQPERVIFSHGRWFERDGAVRLRNSLAWIL